MENTKFRPSPSDIVFLTSYGKPHTAPFRPARRRSEMRAVMAICPHGRRAFGLTFPRDLSPSSRPTTCAIRQPSANRNTLLVAAMGADHKKNIRKMYATPSRKAERCLSSLPSPTARPFIKFFGYHRPYNGAILGLFRLTGTCLLPLEAEKGAASLAATRIIRLSTRRTKENMAIMFFVLPADSQTSERRGKCLISKPMITAVNMATLPLPCLCHKIMGVTSGRP